MLIFVSILLLVALVGALGLASWHSIGPALDELPEGD